MMWPVEQGLDCSNPGSTVRALSIIPGYWRATLTSFTIRECFNPVGDGRGNGVKHFTEPSVSNHLAMPTFVAIPGRRHVRPRT